MFSINRPFFKSIDVIIMQNTCLLRNKDHKMFCFDLKGSSVKRETNLKNANEQIKVRKFPQLMKDINLLDINSMYWQHKLLSIENENKNKLNEIIKKDSEFLQKHKIMDYSLLLVAENLDPSEYVLADLSVTRNQVISKCKSELYHIGIIDYLQDWNVQKRGESFLKSYFLCKRKSQLSAVEPKQYGKRFKDFMREHVLLDEGTSKNAFVKDLKDFKIEE